MRKLALHRLPSDNHGTFGTVVLPTGVKLISGELPWRDNKRASSCIPIGRYEVTWSYSNRFGYCYRVLNVPGRSHILIHPANYLGLASEGFRQELQGCIALGLGVAKHGKQRIITSSRAAVGSFNRSLGRKNFILEITNEQPEQR